MMFFKLEFFAFYFTKWQSILYNAQTILRAKLQFHHWEIQIREYRLKCIFLV